MNFRPLQLEAIQGMLSKRDVVVLLATGGGKSVIYQLPALALDRGFTVIISPLLALARDQVLLLEDTVQFTPTTSCQSPRQRPPPMHPTIAALHPPHR